ncbi:hypothetical protein FIBSPDRAFT_967074 [Athelia psychrophila]|uniref:Uncharacterized protein n=1 Tax=Athelia psychrophila TaxID=1759441 RepID=A0A167W4C8_9AGAM|nr:hypothetical protein FIBSPDRAFT_967074 [Fibularhizoctonia sp. CBS 109695]
MHERNSKGQPSTSTTKSARIAERTTWRWAFWSTRIADAVIGVAGRFFIHSCASRRTDDWSFRLLTTVLTAFPPLLLARKADGIRQAQRGSDLKKGETQYKSVRTPFQNKDHTWKQALARC